jgi:hypothetical protein
MHIKKMKSKKTRIQKSTVVALPDKANRIEPVLLQSRAKKERRSLFILWKPALHAFFTFGTNFL